MPGYPTSCLSNAYILLVPFLRAHRAPAGASPARSCACRSRGASSRRPAGTSSIRCGSPTAPRCRRSRLGRHHQHVARRRLHRDPGADRHRRSGRARRREAVLMDTIRRSPRAPPFELPTQKGECARSRISSRTDRCCSRSIAAPGDRTAAAGSVNWHTTSADYAARGVQVVAVVAQSSDAVRALHRRDGPALRHPDRRVARRAARRTACGTASASTPGTSRGRRCS